MLPLNSCFENHATVLKTNQEIRETKSEKGFIREYEKP